MRQLIEAVALEGQDVHVSARHPLPVEPRVLAIAAAFRVFDRYPALDRLTVTVGEVRVAVSRQDVERLLGPEGFAGLKDPERARAILERAIAESRGDGPG